MSRPAWLAFVAIVGIPAVLGAQASDTSAAPVTISGSVTTSYTWSSHPLGDSVIVGRLYDRHHGAFSLNVVNVTLDRAARTDRASAGFHAEAWFGQNAELDKSVGLTVGPDADIWQAYATLNLPVNARGGALQLKAGKIATLMGVEVGEDVANPNVGVSYQDIFLEPYTETGAELDARASAKWDAELRVSNGWDQVTDVNRGKTVTARLGLTPDERTLVALTGYVGPERANVVHDQRSGANLVASRRITASLTTLLQLDYGEEAGAAAAGGSAAWYGAGAWLTYDLAPSATLAFRADYMNDRDGARTSGVLGFPVNNGLEVGGLTATLNVRRWAHALLRPEIRFDRATLPVFGGHKEQATTGLALSYLF